MLKVDIEQETDGRWIAEIPAIPGVMAYGDTMSEAQHKVEVLALRVIADRSPHHRATTRPVSSAVKESAATGRLK